MQKRTVFFISDSTGITAQTLGQSVLSQFDQVEFESVVIPYIDSEEKAERAVQKINLAFDSSGVKPIVFETVIDKHFSSILAKVNGLRFNMLDIYLKPLQLELGVDSSFAVGKAHGQRDSIRYDSRIDAINFAMDSDDGGKTDYYDKADIILVGVSRCGKTPVCLYLALQYGIYAANYPITEDDLEELSIPALLKPYRDKLFGLTIDSLRLSRIREKRRSDSRYASLKQCQIEVGEVEAIYRRYGIDVVNTTDASVEEIAAVILDKTKVRRL